MSLGAEQLQAFVAENGANFYRLPLNAVARPASRVVLRREPWSVPASYAFGDSQLIPALAGAIIPWKAHIVNEGDIRPLHSVAT